MPVNLPYPKAPEPPRLPTAMTGLPKYRRLFDTGPAPIQPPPNPEVDRITRYPDVGPMSARATYMRYLKGEKLKTPDSIAAQLLQVMQGGGVPLPKGRADVLKQIIQGWLGEGY